ncbi:MAG: hypothetical protein U1E65_12925 [Myxococcota bacterium]
MELEETLLTLVRAVPEALGAILCDFEGEAVVLAAGAAPLLDAQHEVALAHVPRALGPEVAMADLWLRLAGAVPGGVLHQVGEVHRPHGRVALVELGFEEAHVLIHGLPDDYYVLLALRRPALVARARQALSRAAQHLAGLLR